MFCKTLTTNIDFIFKLPGNIATKDLQIKIFDQQRFRAEFNQK